MKLFEKILSLTGAVLLSTTLSHAANEAKSPMGYWKTEESKSKVHVYSCGDKVCGKIVELKIPNDPATGQPKKDKETGVPMLQMEIMKDFAAAGEGKWEGGTVRDPKEGKDYSGEFTLSEDGNTMHLRGYVGITLLGRTQDWHRTTETASLQ